MSIFETIKQLWPWYIAGPIIGLAIPLLLLAGNKMLGISGTLRQICAMCFPANIPFLKYNWKDKLWNIFFAIGLLIGGFIGGVLLKPEVIPAISAAMIKDMQALGISHQQSILPQEIFSWSHLFQYPNYLIVIGGGFLIGFGTRYASGCTSGHGITGLATFQWPSLVAVILFFASGIITANFILLIKNVQTLQLDN